MRHLHYENVNDKHIRKYSAEILSGLMRNHYNYLLSNVKLCLIANKAPLISLPITMHYFTIFLPTFILTSTYYSYYLPSAHH